VRKADNLPPSCADVKKSGGLNLLEPCGPVQACNGTALPFHYFQVSKIKHLPKIAVLLLNENCTRCIVVFRYGNNSLSRSP
jgi:hypothetical protein